MLLKPFKIALPGTRHRSTEMQQRPGWSSRRSCKLKSAACPVYFHATALLVASYERLFRLEDAEIYIGVKKWNQRFVRSLRISRLESRADVLQRNAQSPAQTDPPSKLSRELRRDHACIIRALYSAKQPESKSRSDLLEHSSLDLVFSNSALHGALRGFCNF